MYWYRLQINWEIKEKSIETFGKCKAIPPTTIVHATISALYEEI
jgi:hypothetical protein